MTDPINRPERIAERLRHLEIELGKLKKPGKLYSRGIWEDKIERMERALMLLKTDMAGVEGDYVDLSTNQNVAGIKTFGSIPVLPASNPTTDNQASRKKYIDDLDTANVKLTGNQSVAGIKTFGSIPVLPATNPTTDNQATRKGYVDTSISALGVWQSYTVAWTASGANPSLGNGILIGEYCQIGKLTSMAISLTMGSTTTYGSGNWYFSLPATVASSNVRYLGSAWIYDVSPPTSYTRIVSLSSSASIVQHFIQNAGAASLSPTSPMTWASGDLLLFSVTYRAA
jgi:hypothetical protein